MSAWKPKRFWKTATAEVCEGGFTVRLDGRAVKTPAKSAFVLPTLVMAQAAAAEWDAQVKEVHPETMPVTRMANSAIDKVAVQFDEVAGLLAAYGESDLLCYRAAGPAGLVARQAAAWDPLLDWAASALAAPMVATAGVVHVAQPPGSIAALRARLFALSPFRLAAMHDLISIPGSLILGFAVAQHRLTAAEAFSISRIDEQWQAEKWGEDEEASALEALKRAALAEAARFWDLCG